MIQHSLKQLFVVGAAVALFTSCGSESSWIRNATVTSEVKNEAVYGTVKTQFAGNGLLMPYLSLNIVNPKNPSDVMGHFTMAPVFGSSDQFEMGISVNLSRLVKIPDLRGGSPTLPNGNPIPVAGIDQSSLVVLNVAGSNTKIYVDLNFAKKSALIGAAMPIKEFKNAGQYVPGASIFPSFRMENGVSGVFGVFTSAQADLNGIAAFVDATSLLASAQSKLGFYGATTDAQSEAAVMKSLYNLRGQKLNTAK